MVEGHATTLPPHASAARDPHRTLKGKKPELIKASRYLKGYGYCSSCERWILLSEAPRAKNGYPICPHCHNPLRLKPRCSRSKKKPLWRVLRLLAKRGESA